MTRYSYRLGVLGGRETRGKSLGATFAVLCLVAIACAMSQAIVAPALPAIQRGVGTSAAATGWLLSGNLLAASVATPLLGRLGDMFGKKRMLLVTCGLMMVGAAIGGSADSITLMIVGRIIQGTALGVFPLGFGLVRDSFPKDKVPQAIAALSAAFGIGGGLGVVLAGPIVQYLSFHWLYWIPLLLVGAASVGVMRTVRESSVQSPTAVDWLGGILLAVWLTALLLAITQSRTWGLASGKVLGLLAISVLGLVVWARSEANHDGPMVDVRMLGTRQVWTTNAVGLLFGCGLFGVWVLIPQLVELPRVAGFGFGGSVTTGGLFLLPMMGAMVFSGPLAGRLSQRHRSRAALIVGTIAGCASCTFLAIFHGTTSEVLTGSFLMGVSIGMTLGSMANLILEVVPPTQTGVATGMNTVVRSIGGAVGSQLVATLIAASSSKATRLPSERGFVMAFALLAGTFAVGVFITQLIPVWRNEPTPAASVALVASDTVG